MYTKLLVSFYVLIFGINCALVGIVMHQYWLVILSIANIVALFVILFQHSSLFVSTHIDERVLFSREVFGRLSLWFGIVGTYLYIPYQGSDTFFLYMLIL